MKLNELNSKTTKSKKRLGRGIGSSKGKTCGRGHKGQKSRSGVAIKSFEGGQMPIARRLPKRGFHNLFRKVVAIVNVRDLAVFGEGSTVDVDALMARGLVRGRCDFVKLLADGDAPSGLTVKVHRVSAAARAKIESAGGAVELLG